MLKKCFERKEAQCVQSTDKILDGYIKTDPRVKRFRDPDPESLEKKVRAPQTEKCKRCKETDVHFEVREGVKVCCCRFHVIHPLSFFKPYSLYLQKGVSVVSEDTSNVYLSRAFLHRNQKNCNNRQQTRERQRKKGRTGKDREKRETIESIKALLKETDPSMDKGKRVVR